MRFAMGSLAAVLGAVGALSMFACSPESADDAGSSGAQVSKEVDLYTGPGVLEVRLAAPLSSLFDRLKNGKADPAPEPVVAADDGGADAAADDAADAGPARKYKAGGYSEPGQLFVKVDGKETALDVLVWIRGESSRTDCPFPKLKLDFMNKEQLKGTPFKGHGEVRINTHCGPGEAQTRSQLGRVMNGVGPIREELTYRLLRAMGINTYQTRVLKISYEDPAQKDVIETFAMAMESGDDAAQRFSKMNPPLISADGKLLDSPAWNSTATPENEADVTVAETFAGNKDWGGSHNVDYYGVAGNNTVFKVPQDFDLGAVVLGDVAHYWKGIANVADAETVIKNTPAVAARLKANKAAVEAAFSDAEHAVLKVKGVTSDDGGNTTNDPGFVEAKNRIAQLYALPELTDAPQPLDAQPDAAADDAGDAGAP
jgi:hypothetical protein